MTCMESFTSCMPRACAFGKESANTKATAVRVIFPQTAILQIGDVLLATKLQLFLNTDFQPSKFIWEGARPKTQQMDIIFGLSLFVEKALDLESQGAIAQEDDQQHYDTISCIRIFRWLIAQGCPSSVAAACLRHQVLPPILLNMSGFTSVVINRCSGGLTGSRVAGQLGRIPVQATLRQNLDDFLKLAWFYEGVALAAATFVDNVYFMSTSVGKATQMADLFEERLLHDWCQHIKPSSKEVLPVFGAPHTEPTSEAWKVLSSMSVLGQIIQNTGSIDEDFRQTEIRMWIFVGGKCGKVEVATVCSEL